MSDEVKAGSGATQEEINCEISQVALKENEKVRLVITQEKDGTLSILVKTEQGEDIKEVSFFEIIGLLETAKADLLRQEKQPQQQAPQLVNITLIEEDFELDPEGQLTAQGKKVGDMISIPEFVMELRENAIANLRRQKGEAPGGTPVMKVVRKEEVKQTEAKTESAAEEDK